MEAVDAHLEGVKSFLDEISIGVVNLTAQSESREGSPIAELVDKKHGVREFVFLGKAGQKRN